jgi:hypothetical protein
MMKGEFVQARWMKPVAAVAISAAVAVGTMGVSAASVDAKGTKKQYCKTALHLGSDIQTSPDPSGLSKKNAASLEKSFKKLAKQAPTGALQKASTTIANFYGKIADGDSFQDISSSTAKAYAKAYLTFGTYVATKCVAAAIPDITLPDITLPKLPGG